MPVSFDKLVFAPAVAMIAGTYLINPGVEDAIDNMGALDAADTEVTPLNSILKQAYSSTPGVLNTQIGGNGDLLAEFAGRQCYRSWNRGRPSAEYISNVLDEGHGSIFEHASVVFHVVGVSRSLTHELIRHRVGTAYSQESQRYVDAKDLRFVVPPLLANHIAGMTEAEMDADEELTIFRRSCGRALADYQELQAKFVARLKAMEAAGASEKVLTSAKKRANEAARALLPNAAETRLVFTTNLRALRHILTLRGTEYADLEIRRLVVELLAHSRDYAPHFFADVVKTFGTDGLDALTGSNGKV